MVDDVVEGHAPEVCALGHEECGLSYRGTCTRPTPTWPPNKMEEALAWMQATSRELGHRVALAGVDPEWVKWWATTAVWERRCGSCNQPATVQVRGGVVRVDSTAVRQFCREALRVARCRRCRRPATWTRHGWTHDPGRGPCADTDERLAVELVLEDTT